MPMKKDEAIAKRRIWIDMHASLAVMASNAGEQPRDVQVRVRRWIADSFRVDSTRDLTAANLQSAWDEVCFWILFCGLEWCLYRRGDPRNYYWPSAGYPLAFFYPVPSRWS